MTTFKEFAHNIGMFYPHVECEFIYKGCSNSQFHWAVVLKYSTGEWTSAKVHSYTVDYHMSLAHCTKYESRYEIISRGTTKPRPVREACSPEIAQALYPFKRITLDMAEGYVIPTPPSVEMVLQSLQLDSQAGDISFVDFCSDFGYVSDSRKAYETWQACVNTRLAVKSWLGSEYETFMQLTEE